MQTLAFKVGSGIGCSSIELPNEHNTSKMNYVLTLKLKRGYLKLNFDMQKRDKNIATLPYLKNK